VEAKEAQKRRLLVKIPNRFSIRTQDITRYVAELPPHVFFPEKVLRIASLCQKHFEPIFHKSFFTKLGTKPLLWHHLLVKIRVNARVSRVILLAKVAPAASFTHAVFTHRCLNSQGKSRCISAKPVLKID
jgi:hypothetical protein